MTHSKSPASRYGCSIAWSLFMEGRIVNDELADIQPDEDDFSAVTNQIDSAAHGGFIAGGIKHSAG